MMIVRCHFDRLGLLVGLKATQKSLHTCPRAVSDSQLYMYANGQQSY